MSSWRSSSRQPLPAALGQCTCADALPAGGRLPRGGLFIALLLLSALACGRGLEVTATDVSVLSVNPREIVTRVLRVTNQSGVPGTYDGRLLLPDGWRPLTPDFPFQLAPGATTLRLVSFFAPEHTAAGEYRVGYQVFDQNSRGAVGGGATLLVRVLPVFKLQVDILDLPSVAVVGESYPAVFQVSNYSNAPLTVGFGAESRGGAKITPAVGTLTLAPGESRPVELLVRPPDLTASALDEISLTATAPERGLSDKAKRSVETLPRVTGKENLYHLLRTRFTRRMGVSWGNQGTNGTQGTQPQQLHGGVQIEWSGSGPVDDSGKRFLDFLLRGPDLHQATIFGQQPWFVINYQGMAFDWALGNRTFELSPLTATGAGGIGGLLGWHSDRWRVAAWQVRDWNPYGAGVYGGTGTATGTGTQTGLSVSHAVRPKWWVGLNCLDTAYTRKGHNQVLSLLQQVQLQPDLGLALELAGSRGELGGGAAYWLDLVKLGAPWRYRLNLLYADPDYAGQYRDQNRGHFDLGYTPAAQPWSLSAFYHYDKYNRPQQRSQYPSQGGFQYPYQALVITEPAREEETAGVGAAWRGAAASRYSGELRYGKCSNQRTGATPFADVTRALRLGYGKGFKKQHLNLEASVDLGRRYDHLTGSRVPARGYRGALSWQPSQRLTLGGYVVDTIDPCQGNTGATDQWPTLGLSVGLIFSEKSELSLAAQGQQSAGKSQLMASAQYQYRRDDGDIIGVQCQVASLAQTAVNLMLSYTVPLSVPTLRRTDVATLRGQVFDQENGKGLGNVVLKMDRLVAITDERGYFSFPSVPRGVYELNVTGGRLPVGMIAVATLPLEVDLTEEMQVPVKIPYIRGATIAGRIQVYAPDASLLPSQTFVQVGRGAAAKAPPPVALELKPTHGLARVLVEVRSGQQVFRRLTNGDGEFRFVGLPPGTWTVTIDPAALPENTTIEESSFTLEVKPSADEQLEFKVEQRVRSMRMLAPLKVSG